MMMCLFFQAEDGIRVVAVTGVQTCALPISEKVTPSTKAIVGVEAFGHPGGMIELEQLAQQHELMLIEDSCEGFGGSVSMRSEERRVGKSGDLGRVRSSTNYLQQSIMMLICR